MVDAKVTLYKDIGIDAMYKRTMLFDTKTQQKAWFNAIASTNKLTLSDVNYNKLQNSFVINEQVGDVYGYSYVSVEDIDDSGRAYYGFISNVTLVDDENTRFDIVIDPVQTFMCEWSLGECMVYREHVDRWNTAGLPIRITPSMESSVSYSEINSVTDISQIFQDSTTNEQIVTVILAFTADFATEYEINGSNVQNLIKYMIIPVSLNDLINVYTVYQCTVDGNSSTFYGESPKLSQIISGQWLNQLDIDPNAIIGGWILPVCNLKFIKGSSGTYYGAYGYSDGKVPVTINSGHYTGDITAVMCKDMWDVIVSGSASFQNTFISQVLTESQIQDMLTEPVFEKDITVSCGVAPESATTQASEIHEPALYMEPFVHRYLTDALGTTLLKIPDNLIDYKYEVARISILNAIKTTGVANVFRIKTDDEYGVGVISGTAMAPANTIDIKSDAWKSYCLTQRDSDRRTMWANIISNTVNQAIFMGYGGALVGSRSNSGANDPLKGGTGDSAPIARRGGFGSAMLSAVGFGVGSSLVTSAVSGWAMWEQQEAKEQAVRNEPSTLTAQSDGVVCGTMPYMLVETKADDISYNRAYDNFRIYGYIVRKMEVPNIKSRYYFNYICTTNTEILGALPANVKQDLVSIFEKGITFFHADHCTTTAYPTYENIERSLVS